MTNNLHVYLALASIFLFVVLSLQCHVIKFRKLLRLTKPQIDEELVARYNQIVVPRRKRILGLHACK